MIKNYFLTAFRNILRHKSFSILNILGLALSMSVCLLIIQIMQDQMSHDDFHRKRDRIYRVITNNEMSDGAFTLYATTTFPMGTYLQENYPIVEGAVVINRNFSGDGRANGKVIDFDGFYVNEDFFSVFDFPLEGIDPAHALEDPQSVILSEETARKFYGDTDPVGKPFAVDSMGEYIIAGIVPEGNYKSHIQFDALASVRGMKDDMGDNWDNIYSTWVYILLTEDAVPDDLTKAFKQIRMERYASDPERDFSFRLQALDKICPGPLLGNEIGFFLPRMVIYFMIVLALLLMLTSAFNYNNMSLAKALTRGKEIGIRKVTGAYRSQIFTQFLTESVLAALLALVLAYVFLQFLAPAFEGMRFMSILNISLQKSFSLYILFFIFALLTGIIAGLLPAGYMSTFNPIAVIKDISSIRFLSRMFLRKFLVVAQFAVSIILIVTIVLLYRELRFFLNTDYGFRQENILNVELQRITAKRIRAKFSYLPEIQSIAWSSHVPAIGNIWTEEAWLDDKEDKFDLAFFCVDPNYMDMFELKLLAGSNFPKNLSVGQEKYIILNETAVHDFGFEDRESSLGKFITINDSTLLEVIGVVEDYHFFGMFSKIGPMGLRHSPEGFHYAHLLISSPDMPKTMNKLEKAWEELDPERAFKAAFMDASIREYYLNFSDILYMVGFASLLAIVIACMGLFGMAAYSSEGRIKEIGIRKTMGATSFSIAYLVSRSYIRLIIIALIVALPVSWFGNNIWLQNFPYRVSFGAGTLFFASLFIVLVSFLTILSQTMKAARQNPVESLRYE
jgi:putative ABC transport system permease protein